MKRTILFLFCLMGMTFAFAQSNLQDVVYMKNGEIIRGEIIEMVPGEFIKISLDNGCVFIRDFDDIERFAIEQPIRTFSGPNYDKKSPWLSGVLSYFVPGLGQFYNGECLCDVPNKRPLRFWHAALDSIRAPAIPAGQQARALGRNELQAEILIRTTAND